MLLGAATAYLAGWAFGTRELAALALALALAVAIAWASVWHARRTPLSMERRLPPRAIAGAPLEASVTIQPAPPLVSATIVERCSGLGDPSTVLARGERGLEGTWRVSDPARGRYQLIPEIVLEDPLGLVRAHVPLAAPGRVRVEPELVELGVARAGSLAPRDGMRHAFASSVGDGLAGVRDHEVGESLRRVHWRTTARRGRLTVREHEDHPHEQLHVLLDAAASDGARASRSPAFERAVQAAGSLALHASRCGIAVSFESHGRHELRVVVAGGTRAALLDALCTVEADGRSPLAAQLARADAGRLCVVTSDLSPGAVDRLLRLRARRRAVAVVAIDAGSWEGRSGSLEASVSTLARAGVEIVVVGRGDDLGRQLSPLVTRGVAGAA
ncbi:MAG: hypothetical protein QOH15_1616 [Gaiellales bacterium]|nr:hypothetical protein [Gaiellales bacterium]